MTVALSEEDTKLVRNMIRTNIVALLSQKTTEFKKPERFFLTQFNERVEEEDEKETEEAESTESSKNKHTTLPKIGVIKHGAEMKLQRNILAKYRSDEKEVTRNLVNKRLEFERRINSCKEKQNRLMLKQDQNQQLVQQYSTFINEKDTIRKRAIVKYQTELKTRLQKMLESDVLMKQLETIRVKHDKFCVVVEKNKKFKDFLTRVIEMLPENYLEAGESKYVSLMMRYQTLYESNLDLFENLIANSDKLKTLRNEYERLVIEHNSNIMTTNSILGELQKRKDLMNLQNARAEESYWKDGDKKREMVIDLSKIFWGIDNLAEKSVEKYKLAQRPLETMSVAEKLDSIQSFLLKQSEILKMIKD